MAAFGPWVEIYSNQHRVLAFRVLMLDLVIWCTLLVVLLRPNRWADVRTIRVPRSMVGLAILAACTGVLFGNARGLMEVVQTFDYFVLAYIVFALNERGLRKLPRIFTGFCFVLAAVAIPQFLRNPQSPFAVSSIYEDRNVMGAVMVVLIPSVIAWAEGTARSRTRLFVIAIAFLGLAVTTSAQALVALALAGTVIYLLSKGRAIVWAVLTVSCVALLLARGSVRAGAFEPEDLAGYHDRVKRRALMEVRFTLAEWDVSRWSVVVKAKSATATAADSLRDAAFQTWRRDLFFSEGHHLRQEIIESKAALGLFAASPLVGRGPGMYQEYVSSHYGVAPKLNSMEPNTQSGILLQAAQTGALGTALLLAAVAIPLGAGWRKRREAPLSLPFAGAVGFLAGSLFLPVTQRPESLVLIVALIAYARMEITGLHGTRNSEATRGGRGIGDDSVNRKRLKGGHDRRGQVSEPPDSSEDKSILHRRGGGPSSRGGPAGPSDRLNNGRNLKGHKLREAAITVICVLAVGAATIPLLFGVYRAEPGSWMDSHGGLPVVVLAMAIMALVLRVRRPETLRLSACLLVAWIFSEGASSTILLDGLGAYRTEFHPALVGMALLLAASIATPAGHRLSIRSSLLTLTTAVLLGASLGSVLLWLPVHFVYGEPLRTLMGYLWSFAVVWFALVISSSVFATPRRAKIMIGSVSVGFLLAGLSRVLPI